MSIESARAASSKSIALDFAQLTDEWADEKV
jgi:hypothetical protein